MVYDKRPIWEIAEENRQKRKARPNPIIGTDYWILPKNLVPLVEKAYGFKFLDEQKHPMGWRFTDSRLYVGVLDEGDMSLLVRYAYNGQSTEPLQAEDAIGRANAVLHKTAHWMVGSLIRINWLTEEDLKAVAENNEE